MVKTPSFRWSDKTTRPSDEVFKYDRATGHRFPVSYKKKDSGISAKAGPFSFKTDASTENKFTWTPLSAELKVGCNFGLNTAAKLAAAPAGISFTWSPALPGADAQMLLGVGAGLLMTAALPVGLVGLAGGEKGGNAVDIASYLTLVATALGLMAAQKNMSLKMNLPLVLSWTVHPLIVVSKEEGEEAKFAALDNATTVVKWENNTSKTGAALGIVRNEGAKSDSVPVDVGANAVQTKVAGIDNQS